MKQFFGVFSLGLILIATSFLSACLPSLMDRPAVNMPAPTVGTPTESIKIAMLLPLSGKNAPLGEAMQNAATLAMNDLGSQGIEIDFIDTQSTPEGASAGAQKAINENARLVLGPIFADDVRAARNIMATTTIPMIAFSTDMSVASLGTFIMGVLPQDQARHIAAFAAGRGARNTLLIAPNDPYGQLMVHTYSLTFRGAGGITTGPLWIDANDTDESIAPRIASALSNSNSIKVDSIFLPLPTARATRLAQAVSRFMGATQPMILGTGAWDDVDASASPALSGAFFAAPVSELRTRFEQAYHQSFGAPAPRLASLSYDSVALAITLARTVGPTGYTFTTLTNSNGFTGINGLFRFKSDGTVERSLSIMTIAPGGPQITQTGLPAFTSNPQ